MATGRIYAGTYDPSKCVDVGRSQADSRTDAKRTDALGRQDPQAHPEPRSPLIFFRRRRRPAAVHLPAHGERDDRRAPLRLHRHLWLRLLARGPQVARRLLAQGLAEGRGARRGGARALPAVRGQVRPRGGPRHHQPRRGRGGEDARRDGRAPRGGGGGGGRGQEEQEAQGGEGRGGGAGEEGQAARAVDEPLRRRRVARRHLELGAGGGEAEGGHERGGQGAVWQQGWPEEERDVHDYGDVHEGALVGRHPRVGDSYGCADANFIYSTLELAVFRRGCGVDVARAQWEAFRWSQVVYYVLYGYLMYNPLFNLNAIFTQKSQRTPDL
jgi:hypothetical protein